MTESNESERTPATVLDTTVLDAPRARTAALEAGYASVHLFDSVDSTTTRARELLMNGTDADRESLGELSVFSTLYQSDGRGRLARPWTAPPGACLATSIVVRPHASTEPGTRELPEDSYHWLTLVAGLSVVDIWRYYGAEAHLKWPNDVIANGAKGCGVLAQLVPESGANEGLRSIIVGIGQNTNMTAGQLPARDAPSTRPRCSSACWSPSPDATAPSCAPGETPRPPTPSPARPACWMRPAPCAPPSAPRWP